MKLNVAVFFGGESVEHEVSVISAHQAIAALNKDKYNVIPIYVSKERKLYYSDKLNDMNFFKDLNKVIAESTQISLASIDNKVTIIPVKHSMFGKKDFGTIDVAIPVMHGTNGEDDGKYAGHGTCYTRFPRNAKSTICWM